tara:strand:+ start:275 stop:502 length:228 start_codon:yes stop_codon:yes gene_type:complete
MANNPSEDMYNPPGIGQNDFDEFRFDDIEQDDLFWLKSTNDDNPSYRKMNDTQGYNVQTGIVQDFDRMSVVYQRS